jgi:hypothetical protein
MDSKRANPVISTYTSYRLIAQDIPKSIERIASQPQVARESENLPVADFRDQVDRRIHG